MTTTAAAYLIFGLLVLTLVLAALFAWQSITDYWEDRDRHDDIRNLVKKGDHR